MTTRFIHLHSTDSTNLYLRSLPEQEEDLLVVTTDYQTAGRGQGSNKWESEAGANLLMSVRTRRMEVPVRGQFLLSMAGALAVADTLAQYVDGISLKWPNDVYWYDRKISGTLIETTVKGGVLASCMFGIGVNVNQMVFHSDAPNPVSLRQITGKSFQVEEIAHSLVDRLSQRLLQVTGHQDEMIVTDYHAHLYRRTGFYAYCDAAGPFMARTVRVERDGHLVLCDEMGVQRIYAFKEVAFVI